MLPRILALPLLVASAVAVMAAAPAPATQPTPAALNFKVKDIDGKDVDLAQFKGKVILVVNVASKCGNTPQYAGLEKMYADDKDKGFVILGFPANNFANQEPGTDAEIKDFCTETYKVDFPMFSKIDVKGPNQAPLYKYLTGLETKPQPKGDITWNFEKFLIDRDGKVIARFAPKTTPEDPTLVAAVNAAIAK
ncbi:MAG TPA: glutathione peroxidase [Phycisphaerae bacterium]|nr:glutathione peroxidase [Phycisphaerae bacterium]